MEFCFVFVFLVLVPSVGVDRVNLPQALLREHVHIGHPVDHPGDCIASRSRARQVLDEVVQIAQAVVHVRVLAESHLHLHPGERVVDGVVSLLIKVDLLGAHEVDPHVTNADRSLAVITARKQLVDTANAAVNDRHVQVLHVAELGELGEGRSHDGGHDFLKKEGEARASWLESELA